MAVDGCKHHANRRVWEARSREWSDATEKRGLWREAVQRPEAVLGKCELDFLSDLKGLEVAVLGSGDNQNAFAFAGMGARVTSVDVAQGQLDAARRRADSLGLSMTFVKADVTHLEALADESFDVVYTGGHVAVWVSDLYRYYGEALRILRRDGRFLVNEYHPVRRIWRDRSDRLEVERSYFDRAVQMYETNASLFNSGPGLFLSYEFHYTIADFIKAIGAAGGQIHAFEEWSDHQEGWEGAPLKGLPHWLMLGAVKIGACTTPSPQSTSATVRHNRGIFSPFLKQAFRLLHSGYPDALRSTFRANW